VVEVFFWHQDTCLTDRQTHPLLDIRCQEFKRVTSSERCALHTDFTHVLCGFAYLTRLGVQLLQIQIYFCNFFFHTVHSHELHSAVLCYSRRASRKSFGRPSGRYRRFSSLLDLHRFWLITDSSNQEPTHITIFLQCRSNKSLISYMNTCINWQPAKQRTGSHLAMW
jgi:hypothetical protein